MAAKGTGIRAERVNVVRKLLVGLVFCLSLVASAEPWSQQGELWTLSGASVTIPAALKPKVDGFNVLEAEGGGISVSFQLLPEKEDFNSFCKRAAKLLQGFKGIQWSEPQVGQEGELQMALRLGRFRSKEASLEFALSVFQKGKVKLGIMSVQRSGDAVASRLISQMVNSIQIR